MEGNQEMHGSPSYRAGVLKMRNTVLVLLHYIISNIVYA